MTLVLDREIDASRGDVLAAAPAPALAEQIDARVVWMDDTSLFRGRAYQLMLGTQSVVGTVTDITSRLDIETLEETPARELHMNEIGRVTLSLSHPVACEPYVNSRELGGFILVDRLTRNTVGAGMVTALQGARENVYWHQLDVDKAARATLNGQKPSVLWFTGLSGAGKSTIANLVEKRLHAAGRHTMILDGDNVRHGLNRDLGFTEADRVENIRRVAEVAKLFVDAGLIVLVSFISPYRAERMLAREAVEDGRVPGDLRRYAGGRVPAARSEGAVPAGGCRAVAQLHRGGRAVRGAARSGDPAAHAGTGARGAGRAGGAGAAAAGDRGVGAGALPLDPTKGRCPLRSLRGPKPRQGRRPWDPSLGVAGREGWTAAASDRRSTCCRGPALPSSHATTDSKARLCWGARGQSPLAGPEPAPAKAGGSALAFPASPDYPGTMPHMTSRPWRRSPRRPAPAASAPMCCRSGRGRCSALPPPRGY